MGVSPDGLVAGCAVYIFSLVHLSPMACAASSWWWWWVLFFVNYYCCCCLLLLSSAGSGGGCRMQPTTGLPCSSCCRRRRIIPTTNGCGHRLLEDSSSLYCCCRRRGERGAASVENEKERGTTRDRGGVEPWETFTSIPRTCMLPFMPFPGLPHPPSPALLEPNPPCILYEFARSSSSTMHDQLGPIRGIPAADARSAQDARYFRHSVSSRSDSACRPETANKVAPNRPSFLSRTPLPALTVCPEPPVRQSDVLPHCGVQEHIRLLLRNPRLEQPRSAVPPALRLRVRRKHPVHGLVVLLLRLPRLQKVLVPRQALFQHLVCQREIPNHQAHRVPQLREEVEADEKHLATTGGEWTDVNRRGGRWGAEGRNGRAWGRKNTRRGPQQMGDWAFVTPSTPGNRKKPARLRFRRRPLPAFACAHLLCEGRHEAEIGEAADDRKHGPDGESDQRHPIDERPVGRHGKLRNRISGTKMNGVKRAAL